MTIPEFPRGTWLLVVLTAAAAANGCTTLSAPVSGLMPFGGSNNEIAAPPQIDPNAPQVTMEIHPAKGKPQKLHAPLTEPISVQQAVEETGLADRFRRMRITIFRPNRDGSFARLGVKFDKHKGRVDTSSDYLLHPGDRIMVEEDTTTILGDMMEPWLGPLSNAVWY